MTTSKQAPEVPAISDADLADLMARFQPVVLVEGRHYLIEDVDPRRTAFTWSPKRVGAVTFRPLRDVPTDHLCGHPSMFKPSIAEVLAQVPADIPAEANAFCIDLAQGFDCYPSGTGHRVVTTFGRVEP